MRPVVVKLGGSVITDKTREFSIRKTTVRRLAKELKVEERMVLVHGGGSFGHPLARRYKLNEGFKHQRQLMGFAKVQRAMILLNSYILEELHRAGIPAVSVQPSACAIVENGRIRSMELDPIKKLMDLRILPVLYGDAVVDMKRGMGILSGDQLVVHLALNLNASRVVLGVDVDGVFTSDPKLNPEAELIGEITPESWRRIRSRISVSSGSDVTGGMFGKVRELLTLARWGIEAQVVNAGKRGVLRRAICGDRGLGTLITVGE